MKSGEDKYCLQSEERARRQRAAIAALVVDDTLVAGEMPAAFHRISEMLSKTIGVARASIWSLSPDNSELHCLSLFEAEKSKHSEGAVLQTALFPRYFAAILTESRIYAEDAQTDPCISELSESYLVPLGITSMLDAGIIMDGSLRGVVSLEHTGKKRKWHSDEEAFVSTAASIVAQVFINARRKQAEATLQESEERLRMVLDNFPDGIIVLYDREFRCNFAEGKGLVEAGLSREILLGKQPRDIFPPDLWEVMETHISDAFNGRQSTFEIQWEEKVFTQTVLPFRLKDKIVAVMGVINNITDRKRAETALRQSEERFSYIAEFSPLPLAIIDENGNYEYINPQFKKVFGYTLDHIPIGKQWFRRAFPDPFYRREVIKAWLDDLETLGPNMVRPRVLEVTCKDGAVKDIYFRPVLMDNGKQVLICEDITKRKRADAVLRHSEGRFRQIAEASPLPLSISDAEGRNEYLNPKFEEIFGYTLTDIPTRQKWFELAYPDPDYRRFVMEAWLQDAHRKPGNVCIPRQFRVICKDGSAKEILYRLVSMENGSRLIIYEDITERLKTEKDVQDRNMELSTLYTLSTHMRAAKSSADLMPIVLEESRRLFHAADGMVILLEPEHAYCTISVGNGHWADSVGKSLPLDQGCLSIVLAGGKPYVSLDYSVDKHALPLEHGTQTGPAVFVPLQSQETILGILVLARRRTTYARPFSPAEVHLLTTIGEMSGNALHRQQLHERAREQMEQLQALRKIDTAITGNLDLHATLQITLAQVTEMLHVDGAAILRLDPCKTLKYAAWLGFCTANPGEISLSLGDKWVDKTYNWWSSAVTNQSPIVIPDLRKAKPALQGHALIEKEGFLAYGAVPLVARNEVQGILEVFHRKPLHPGKDWLKFMETLAGQAAIAIDNDHLFTSLERTNVELTLAYDATIEGWAYALDLRDEETEGHSQRVTQLTVMLAIAMGIPEEQLLHIRRGALLHDIGKMGIPDAILLKPGKLTDKEWEIMRCHPHYAHEMLRPIEYLRPALQIPFCHHEKWSGGGYPRGLKGETIPLEARIFAVVDVYDALTSDRPYRPAWTREQTLELISGEKGKHFDPRVVELFLQQDTSRLNFEAEKMWPPHYA